MTNNIYTKVEHRFILQTGLGIRCWHNEITDRYKDGGLEQELGLQYHYKRFIV
jgi:hypothetical protein